MMRPYASTFPLIIMLTEDNLRAIRSNFVEHLELCGSFSRESIDFQVKVLERSGIGDEACVPSAMHKLPVDTSLNPSLEEVELVLFTIVEDLLSKHNPFLSNSFHYIHDRSQVWSPKQHQELQLKWNGLQRGSVIDKSGKDLLKVHKNSVALVLSMEAVTPSGYTGQSKSMLVANTIFRMGGVAVLLSNKRKDKRIARYKLHHLVRTHTGYNDQSYNCVFQQTDEDGISGVHLSRSVLHVASNSLKINISKLGPLVLPYSEQLRYCWCLIRHRIWGRSSTRANDTLYVPNFKKVFNHFCIHAGGRAIIDGVEKKLNLQREDGEASRMTLYRFGNTSSSSVWYELCYLEAKGKVKKGDKIWQIAFGSGFKCNSAVWESVSDMDSTKANAWSDRIHLYPVELSNKS
ncbi:hypothetical protein K2173_015446 [Erythroxylum novogranatense]|uniref:very-long-chain 3-oxoacyl-CoA synthase n=1 Tax=Erythroxylum novogranatense TaxID=1862640 RepID=A0AAV8SSV4_9ROSI|nr:hypothetical protein K2173_015446 [Erythroxylum novogranatense]